METPYNNNKRKLNDDESLFSRFDLNSKHMSNCVKKFLSNTNHENYTYKICAICSEKRYNYTNQLLKKNIEIISKYKTLLHF